MICEEMTLLLSARLDGELTQEEQAALEQHLAQCPACRAVAEQLEQIHSAFDQLEDVSVPEGFAQGVMDRIRAEEPSNVMPLFRRPQFKVAAAAAACALLCIGLWRSSQSTPADQGPTPYIMTASDPMAADMSTGELPPQTSRIQEPEQSEGFVPSNLRQRSPQEIFDQYQQSLGGVLVLTRLPADAELDSVPWQQDETGCRYTLITGQQCMQLEELAAAEQLEPGYAGEENTPLPCLLVILEDTL